MNIPDVRPLFRCLLALSLFLGSLGIAACQDFSRPADNPSPRTVTLTFQISRKGNFAPDDYLEFIAALPQTLPGRQHIGEMQIVPPPRTFSENGVLYGKWHLPLTAEKTSVKITIPATLRAFRIEQRPLSGAADNPRAWLAGEKHLETAAPEIQALAATIPPGGTPLATARAIYQTVLDNLKYRGFVAGAEGARAAAIRGTGDCTDFSDLFVALCRAKNIPARHVSGYLTRYTRTPLHSWAEFHTPENGWVPVDVLHGKLGKTPFGQLPAHYLYISPLRNDSHFGGGMLYRWQLHASGKGSVAVRAELR